MPGGVDDWGGDTAASTAAARPMRVGAHCELLSSSWHVGATSVTVAEGASEPFRGSPLSTTCWVRARMGALEARGR